MRLRWGWGIAAAFAAMGCLVKEGEGESRSDRFSATDDVGRGSVAMLVVSTIGSDPSDAGMEPDAGAPPPDGGTSDGGTSDGGASDGGTAPAPGGWQFFGTQNGGPVEALGVTSDEGGNIWVAGGNEGLYLLAPGSTQFRRFTVADGLTGYNDGTGVRGQRVISVAGGPAGTVFVGYQGLPGCQDAFERYNFKPGGGFVLDPAHQYIWKSGDADRVSLSGTGISVTHYDISSGPNQVAAEPQGREKLCTVLRVAYHAATHSVWFGGNHGVAWGDSLTSAVTEHTHPAINGYIQTGGGYSYTLLTDAYYGLSVLPNGDLWLGGANRSAKFRWASLGRNFWGADSETRNTMVDLWPDAVAVDSYPSQRLDDNVSDMAALPDGTVWASSISNGLAHWTPSGTTFLRLTTLEPRSKATSLEVDPQDGSLWVGFIYGGISRVKDGQVIDYGFPVFGTRIQGRIPDIASDLYGGYRRILVAFSGESHGPPGVGIYTGN